MRPVFWLLSKIDRLSQDRSLEIILQDAFKLDHHTAATAITGAGKPNFSTPVERGILQVDMYKAGQSGFAAAAFLG